MDILIANCLLEGYVYHY